MFVKILTISIQYVHDVHYKRHIFASSLSTRKPAAFERQPWYRYQNVTDLWGTQAIDKNARSSLELREVWFIHNSKLNTFTFCVQIVAVLDPASNAAQKLAPLLLVLRRVVNCRIKLFMNPQDKNSDMPLKRWTIKRTLLACLLNICSHIICRGCV